MFLEVNFTSTQPLNPVAKPLRNLLLISQIDQCTTVLNHSLLSSCAKEWNS
jgi:hypothetical protein